MRRRIRFAVTIIVSVLQLQLSGPQKFQIFNTASAEESSEAANPEVSELPEAPSGPEAFELPKTAKAEEMPTDSSEDIDGSQENPYDPGQESSAEFRDSSPQDVEILAERKNSGEELSAGETLLLLGVIGVGALLFIQSENDRRARVSAAQVAYVQAVGSRTPPSLRTSGSILADQASMALSQVPSFQCTTGNDRTQISFGGREISIRKNRVAIKSGRRTVWLGASKLTSNEKRNLKLLSNPNTCRSMSSNFQKYRNSILTSARKDNVQRNEEIQKARKKDRLQAGRDNKPSAKKPAGARMKAAASSSLRSSISLERGPASLQLSAAR